MNNASVSIDTVSVSLYNAAAGMQTTGNLLVSPISIIYATLLVYLGSGGKTKSNLGSKLHFEDAFGSNSADISKGFGDLMNQLKVSTVAGATKKPQATSQESHHGDTATQIALANGAFIQAGSGISQDYLSDISRNLKVTPTTVNFITEAEKVRGDINTWVEQRTGGKIKDLIPRGALDSATRLVLANALYFKGSWEKPFPETGTVAGPFLKLDGKSSDVKFMHLGKQFKYAEDTTLGVQYLEMPYADSASMLVFLPRQKAGLRNLEKSLTPQAIEALSTTAKRKDIVLTFPKFKFDSNFDLKVLLEKIGVRDVFADDADLTGMVPAGGLKVSAAFHKTFVDVDEKGTEAAAASAMAVSMRLIMVPQGDPIEFKADHPFMFAIRHNPSKSLLFLGRLETV